MHMKHKYHIHIKTQFKAIYLMYSDKSVAVADYAVRDDRGHCIGLPILALEFWVD